MLSDREDRRIRRGILIVIVISAIFLMCLLAASGCAHRDMSQHEAVNIVNLAKKLQ